jgi:hypothetical protein
MINMASVVLLRLNYMNDRSMKTHYLMRFLTFSHSGPTTILGAVSLIQDKVEIDGFILSAIQLASASSHFQRSLNVDAAGVCIVCVI